MPSEQNHPVIEKRAVNRHLFVSRRRRQIIQSDQFQTEIDSALWRRLRKTAQSSHQTPTLSNQVEFAS